MKKSPKKIKSIYRYLIVRCPQCKQIQTTESKTGLNCTYCMKRSVYKNKNEFGLNVKILFKTNSPREASIKCGEFKAKRWERDKDL